ncbi:unnamed protein product [Ectocarpus sp. 12 AP-2014]
MGCHASKKASLSGEIRSEELAKCAAVSGEVRWVWLRSRSLFSFAELRSLFKQFQVALRASSQQQQQPGELQCHDLLGTASQPAPVCSVEATKGGDGAPSCGGAPGSAMSKAQFLSLCESSDAFRLSEVVGAFGSRLFDVLDASGVGFLDFETLVLGLSKLLKGPERERLKLLYSAYDLSGVAPSEERWKSTQSSGGSSSLSGGSSTAGGGGGGGGGGGKAKPSRRSKYLTLEDITAVLASASQAAAYPALLSFTTDGKGGMTTGHLSGGGVIGGGGGGGTGGDGMFCCSCCWCCTGCNGDGCSGGGGAGAGGGGVDNDDGLCGGGECKGRAEKSPRNGGEGGLPSNQDSLRNSGEGRKEACGGGGGGSSSSSSSCGSGGSGRSSRRGCRARVSRDPEALAELLREMAQRNAERYAVAAVSEFGQAQGGAGLTQKEFEKWALTGPVLRCRINEFSIDLNLAPFQGVRLW